MTLPDFDEKTFFDYARRAPFGNRLSQSQVDGIKRILGAWASQYPNGVDDRWIAYSLATAFHETGGQMLPVREGFAKTDIGARRAVAGRRYAVVDPATAEVYYGRGPVQLTWAVNYRSMGRVLGVKLYEHPDLALDPEIGARILVEGMTRGISGKGDFTGKALEDYFNASKDDPEGARRIINGTDKASLIAGYHRNFLDSIVAARAAAKATATVGFPEVRPPDGAADRSAQPVPPPAAGEPAAPSNNHADKPPLKTDPTTIGAVLAGLGGAGGIIGTVINQVSNPWAFAAFAVVAIGVYLVLSGRLKIRYDAGV